MAPNMILTAMATKDLLLADVDGCLVGTGVEVVGVLDAGAEVVVERVGTGAMDCDVGTGATDTGAVSPPPVVTFDPPVVTFDTTPVVTFDTTSVVTFNTTSVVTFDPPPVVTFDPPPVVGVAGTGVATEGWGVARVEGGLVTTETSPS